MVCSWASPPPPFTNLLPDQLLTKEPEETDSGYDFDAVVVRLCCRHADGIIGNQAQ